MRNKLSPYYDLLNETIDEEDRGDVSMFPTPATPSSLVEQVRQIITDLSNGELELREVSNNPDDEDGLLLKFSGIDNTHGITFIVGGETNEDNPYPNIFQIWEIDDDELLEELQMEGTIFGRPTIFNLKRKGQVAQLKTILRKYLKRPVELQESVDDKDFGDVNAFAIPARYQNSVIQDWVDRLVDAGLDKPGTINLCYFYLYNPEEIPEDFPDPESLKLFKNDIFQILRTLPLSRFEESIQDEDTEADVSSFPEPARKTYTIIYTGAYTSRGQSFSWLKKVQFVASSMSDLFIKAACISSNSDPSHIDQEELQDVRDEYTEYLVKYGLSDSKDSLIDWLSHYKSPNLIISLTDQQGNLIFADDISEEEPSKIFLEHVAKLREKNDEDFGDVTLFDAPAGLEGQHIVVDVPDVDDPEADAMYGKGYNGLTGEITEEVPAPALPGIDRTDEQWFLVYLDDEHEENRYLMLPRRWFKVLDQDRTEGLVFEPDKDMDRGNMLVPREWRKPLLSKTKESTDPLLGKVVAWRTPRGESHRGPIVEFDGNVAYIDCEICGERIAVEDGAYSFKEEVKSKIKRTDPKFMKAFYHVYLENSRYDLKDLDGFPEGLDLENCDIVSMGSDYIQFEGGGDWQNPVSFSLVVSAAGEPRITGVYDSIDKTPKKEINAYIKQVEELVGAKKESKMTYRNILRETRLYENAEDIAQDLSQMQGQPIESEIPPPPDATPEPASVPDTQPNNQDQQVQALFTKYYPTMGTPGAVQQISKDLKLPYAAAHAMVTHYLSQFSKSPYDKDWSESSPGDQVDLVSAGMTALSRPDSSIPTGNDPEIYTDSEFSVPEYDRTGQYYTRRPYGESVERGEGEEEEEDYGDISRYEEPSWRNYFIDYVLYGPGGSEYYHAKFAAPSNEEALKIVIENFTGQSFENAATTYETNDPKEILDNFLKNSDMMDIIEIHSVNENTPLYIGRGDFFNFDDTEDTMQDEDWDEDE